MRVQKDATVPQSLDSFLSSVERGALRMAQLGTRDTDEAMDCVTSRRNSARPFASASRSLAAYPEQRKAIRACTEGKPIEQAAACLPPQP
jgi:hypothetical protein